MQSLIAPRRFCNMPLVELQNFLNDLVTDSSHVGRVRSAPTPSNSHGGGSRPPKKRLLDEAHAKGTKRFARCEGSGRRRG
jgi:hypothetical protein